MAISTTLRNKQQTTHPKADLELARHIVMNGLEGHPTKIYLFGSRATGGAARASDIDIGILPLTPLPEGKLGEIREELTESHIIYEVDLIDLSSAGKALRERVLKEGIEWKE